MQNDRREKVRTRDNRGAISFAIVWLASAHAAACCGAPFLEDNRFESTVTEVVEHRLSEEVVEKTLKTRMKLDIAALSIPPGDRRYQEDEIFRDNGASDLILGISVEGASRGHAYVILGLEGIEDWIRRRDYGPLVRLLDQGRKQVRFDGRMFYIRHRITTRIYPPQSKLSGFSMAQPLVEPILNNGIFLRYRAIPLEHRMNMITRLYEISESGESVDPIRAISCVAAACELIWENGQFLLPSEEMSVSRNGFPGWKLPHYPGPLLRHLARHGLVDRQGNRLEPEIYALNTDPVEFWRDRPTPGNLGILVVRGMGEFLDRPTSMPLPDGSRKGVPFRVKRNR